MRKRAAAGGGVSEEVVATWAAEAIWAASAAAISAQVGVVSAEATWREWPGVAAMADVVSLAAIRATALVARITRRTHRPTPAPTDWCADSEVADARLSLSASLAFELASEKTAHPDKRPHLDAALCGIKVNSRESQIAIGVPSEIMGVGAAI